MQKTYMHKPADVERQWHLIDAKGRILGKVAAEIAQLLIGKHKKEFTPHVDGGDYVVVINAAAVAVTGNKMSDKKYYRHSGFPGGLKVRTLDEVLTDFPERVIEKAVKNMLPKNKHQDLRMNRLKVYAGEDHKHQSQLASGEVETSKQGKGAK